jgi:hypothetical protein
LTNNLQHSLQLPRLSNPLKEWQLANSPCAPVTPPSQAIHHHYQGPIASPSEDPRLPQTDSTRPEGPSSPEDVRGGRQERDGGNGPLPILAEFISPTVSPFTLFNLRPIADKKAEIQRAMSNMNSETQHPVSNTRTDMTTAVPVPSGSRRGAVTRPLVSVPQFEASTCPPEKYIKGGQNCQLCTASIPEGPCPASAQDPSTSSSAQGDGPLHSRQQSSHQKEGFNNSVIICLPLQDIDTSQCSEECVDISLRASTARWRDEARIILSHLKVKEGAEKQNLNEGGTIPEEQDFSGSDLPKSRSTFVPPTSEITDTN